MNAQNNKQYGWLTWWTINTAKIHSVNKIAAMAKARANFPAKIADGIKGEDAESAWQRATRIPARGIEASGMSSGVKGRYVTRDLSDGTRMIALETLDEQDRKISSERVALMWRSKAGMGHGHSVETGPHAGEVESLIDGMYGEAANREGNIDGGRIRSLVLEWLRSVNRVTLRGSAGGVYFVPLDDGRDDQLLAVRDWMAETEAGSMTVVEMWEGKATTIADVQASALDEIRDEVSEINQALTGYANNPLQNDGSRMVSANMMSDKVDGLIERAQALSVILEDKLGTVQEMLALVKKRAVVMAAEASAAVAAAKPLPAVKVPKAGKPQSGSSGEPAPITPTLADVQAQHAENMASANGADAPAPKKKGRPPGSKNKPAALQEGAAETAKKVGTTKKRASKVKL